MKNLKILVLSAILFMGLSGLAGAVDMSGRFGVGFNTQIGLARTDTLMGADTGIGVTTAVTSTMLDMSALSVKYHVSPLASIAVLLGFGYGSVDPEGGDNEVTYSNIGLGAKLFYNFRQEKQMNLYGGGGFMFVRTGFESQADDSDGSLWGIKIPIFAGAEFFFNGLPNLGFSLETGLEFLIGGGSVDVGNQTVDTSIFNFGTFGGLFDAGIHYYF
jgi:hypothetical protein